VTVTAEEYHWFVPAVPLSDAVLTGATVSPTLPGASVYVDAGAAGIVTVRPPVGVDCALPTRAVPPAFDRVKLYVVPGVKPVPSNTTSAALVSWKPTLDAEKLVGLRLAMDPDQEACNVSLSAELPVS
jgi:hypothetical protein